MAESGREGESQRREPERAANDAGESDESRRASDEKFWQWVALVVLLGCWLAEAQL